VRQLLLGTEAGCLYAVGRAQRHLDRDPVQAKVRAAFADRVPSAGPQPLVRRSRRPPCRRQAVGPICGHIPGMSRDLGPHLGTRDLSCGVPGHQLGSQVPRDPGSGPEIPAYGRNQPHDGHTGGESPPLAACVLAGGLLQVSGQTTRHRGQQRPCNPGIRTAWATLLDATPHARHNHPKRAGSRGLDYVMRAWHRT